MAAYDVFLSHASSDRAQAEVLARRLREDGVEPFLDRWHLVPGEPWQEALERALRLSRSCVLLVGDRLGPWQHEEMRVALDRRVDDPGFRVIPVLLPGARRPSRSELPLFLQRLTWVDFRAGVDDADAYRRLVSGIRGVVPGAGYAAAPETGGYRAKLPPRTFFVRRRELDDLRKLILRGIGSRGTTTTVLRGAGGFGKTALARALCDDSEVRRMHPDGILWTTLGEALTDADRVDRVLDLVRWWTGGEPPRFKSPADAGDHLSDLLAGRRVLVVVDDIWRAADLDPFLRLTSGSVLVTTRNLRSVPQGVAQLEVDGMAEDEAAALLAHGVELPGTEELTALAGRLGEWPLLLKLVNGQLQALVAHGMDPDAALSRIAARLDRIGMRAFDHRDPRERGDAVSLTIGVSLELLAREDRRRFLDLAVFPQGTDVPLRVVERYWDLEDWEAEELCVLLADHSLLFDLDLAERTIRLHDVVRQHLIERTQDPAALHRRLLERCRPASGRWTDTGDAYLYRWLPHHLREAGALDCLEGLLTDYRWLSAKLEATRHLSLMEDFDLLDEPAYRVLREAVRLSGHVLARDPSQLASQLHGRLDATGSPGIGRVLASALDCAPRPWVRPTRPTLETPGGQLIRTLTGHTGSIRAMAFHRGGQLLVTASSDTTMKLWDLDSGQELWSVVAQTTEDVSLYGARWERRVNGIDWIAIAPDGRRAITQSSDDRLRFWDLDDGELLKEVRRKHRLKNAVTPDGRFVLSASFDEDPQLWSGLTGEDITTLGGHSDWVAALAVTADGERALTAYGGLLRLWDLGSGDLLRTFPFPFKTIFRAELTADGRHALIAGQSTSGDGGESEPDELGLFDLDRGRLCRSYEGAGRGFTVSTDGKLVAADFSGQAVGLWDVATGEALAIHRGHSTPLTAIAVDSANRRIATADKGGTVKLWHFGLQGSEREDLPRSRINCLALLPDGERLLLGHADGSLHLRHLPSDEVLETYPGHARPILALAITPDGSRAITASEDYTLKLWDLAGGTELRTFRGHGGAVSAVCVLPDGRHALSGGYSRVHLRELDTGRTVRLFIGHKPWVTWLAATPSGDRFLVACGRDADQLMLRDVEQRTECHVLEGHTAPVNTVVVIDDRRAVSASRDRSLILWDLESRQALRTFVGHERGVLAVDYRDGCLATTSYDNTLRLWELDSGRCLATFVADDLLTTVVMLSQRTLVAGDAFGVLHHFEVEGL